MCIQLLYLFRLFLPIGVALALIKTEGFSQNNSSSEINAELEKGQAFSKQQKYDSAVVYFQKAQIVFQSIEDWNAMSSCWFFEATIHLQKNDYQKMKFSLEKANSILDDHKIKNDSLRARINNYFGVYFRGIGDYDSALSYFEEALKYRLADSTAKQQVIIQDYSNVGASYRIKGDYDKAIAYYERCLYFLQRNVENPVVFRYFFLYNNFGTAYQAKREYAKALHFYFLALEKIIDEDPLNLDLQGRHFDIYNNLAEIYVELNKPDSALFLFTYIAHMGRKKHQAVILN